MTHYSTRIEGNTLDFEQVSRVVKQNHHQARIPAEQEVRNYWEALSFLTREKQKRIQITETFIQKLHSIIIQQGAGRKPVQSEYRGSTPPGVLFAVFDNITGQADYIPPEYSDVPSLMSDFVDWIKNEKELPAPVKAAIVTYQFLTIHPFEDGNGRTARALAFEKVANLAKRYAHNEIDARVSSLEPNEKILLRYLLEKNRPVKPKEIAALFQVHSRTISKWATQWMESEIIEPASGDKRVTSYKLGKKYQDLTLNDLGYAE